MALHSDGFDRRQLESAVMDQFERIAAIHPDRIAVMGLSGEWTYAELNREANRIAHSLFRFTSRSAQPIALVVEDECRSAASVLGTLKSGNFYVPLDVSHPRERLSAILDDGPIRIILTDAKKADWVHEIAGPDRIVLRLHELDPNAPSDNLRLPVSMDAIAAIFYTSGSTGRPKGVMQSQRNILHRVMVSRNAIGIRSDDRVCVLNSPAYSASLRPLFSALLNGAAILPFHLLRRQLNGLTDWICNHNVTIYHSVASTFRRWASSLTGTEDIGSLRIVNIGGETVTRTDVELFQRRFPAGCILVASYASNETGMIRQYLIDKTTVAERLVPAGHAVNDKEVLILDDMGRELGFNQVGEIAVRSAFLSPGYWMQPELTAAAFRTDPSMPEKRIFKTGDLGSMRPDGCLLYEGRKHFRAKIHGSRVEVEDVEAALMSHPAIQECAVAAPEGEDGEQSLVAYVVTGEEASLTAAGVREYLVEKLPAYMLPSAVLFFNELPRTLTGKLDRRGLPPPSAVKESAVCPTFDAPRKRVEQIVAQIFEQVLQKPNVGRNDNFFALGGDSLRAVQVMARLVEALGLEISLPAFFRHPTPAALAVEIDASAK